MVFYGLGAGSRVSGCRVELQGICDVRRGLLNSPQ